MQFGFTLKPEHNLARTVELSKRAEANGFERIGNLLCNRQRFIHF